MAKRNAANAALWHALMAERDAANAALWHALMAERIESEQT